MFRKLSLMGGVLVLSAVAAQAEPRIFPYSGVANNCPAGQQPVTIDGVICCGVPNQGMSYQSAMSHPTKKRHVVRRVVRPAATNICPEGVKGCVYN